MKVFRDTNGNTVKLVFNQTEALSKPPRHVIVICQYEDKWLLTNHKKRGLEFPGGKVEEGESLIEAAKREVFEETGAILETVQYIGQYEVTSGDESFVKAIFYGKVERMKEKPHYFETNGPFLLKGNLIEKRHGQEFSFIMKDSVIEQSIMRIEHLKMGVGPTE